MADRIGADLAGNFDLALGNQRPGNRRAEKINAFIQRVGAEHRKDEIADEFLAQVVDEDFLHPCGLGLFPRRLDFLALTEIGGECHHLAAIDFLQPFEDDGCIQPA